ncbi:hypothetical protein DKP78_19280, partial [Enterococcus faecium]
MLKEFFQLNDANPSIDDLIAILRRIDRDCDGKISYKEFLDAIRPLNLGKSAFTSAKRSPTKSLKSNKGPDSSLKEKQSPTKSIEGHRTTG